MCLICSSATKHEVFKGDIGMNVMVVNKSQKKQTFWKVVQFRDLVISSSDILISEENEVLKEFEKKF